MRPIVFLSLAILFLTLPQRVMAMLDPGSYTESEKAGFAFYKLLHRTPDFRIWVRQEAEDSLHAGQPAGPAPDAIVDPADQLARLQAGFRVFAPDEDMIKIVTTASLSTPFVSDAEAAGEYAKVKPIRIDLGANIAPTAFPLHIGHMWIAIVPKKDALFKSFDVSNETRERIQNELEISNGGSQDIRIELTLRPDHADGRKPMMLYHQEMWLMMASIADFQIWDKDRKVMIWSYSAPWYSSTTSHDLLDLYQR